MNFIESRKQKRLHELVEGKLLSDKQYNLALGANILYGLVMNILLCFIVGDRMASVNPILFFIGYFICVILGILLSALSRNPMISFIGYNFIAIPIGLVLSIAISAYVAADMGHLIPQAVLLTAVVTFTMIGLSIAFAHFFSGLGKILFGCLIGLILAEILALFFFPGVQNILIWLGIILFSLYIGYDYWKAQQYPKTLDNAVDCAIDIYLDIINLFIRILEILGNKKSSSRK